MVLLFWEIDQEDNDSYVPNEEELDWEDGDEGAKVGGTDDTTPQKGWSGKITFDADGSPGEDLERKSKKSPLRRANANDKVFKLAKISTHVCIFRGEWKKFLFRKRRGLSKVLNSDTLQVRNDFNTVVVVFIIRPYCPLDTALVGR